MRRWLASCPALGLGEAAVGDASITSESFDLFAAFGLSLISSSDDSSSVEGCFSGVFDDRAIAISRRRLICGWRKFCLDVSTASDSVDSSGLGDCGPNKLSASEWLMAIERRR